MGVVKMNAKAELEAALCAAFPGGGEQIRALMRDYVITREEEQTKGDMVRRVSQFLAAKRIDGLSERTIRNYRYTLGLFTEQVHKQAARVTADDIRTYLAYLLERRKLSESSLGTHINTLRSFFTWLLDEEITKRNPMSKIKSPKIDRKRSRRPLTEEELERLRDACQDYRERAVLEFYYSSGCRLSEAVGVPLSAVDLEGRSLVVIGKGDKQRTVYFSVRARLMLEEYTRRRKGGTALFCSSKAPYRPLCQRSIEKIVERIGQRAGLAERIHPHLLRHTMATLAYNRGMPLAMIQELLGHEDPGTTQIYASMSQDTVRREYERFVA